MPISKLPNCKTKPITAPVPLENTQKTAWADIVDDPSPGPIVQGPPSIDDELHTALSNGEVTLISTATLKNTMLQYERITHEVTEWQKWWYEQCCYFSPFLAGETLPPAAPETDDHSIEADAQHPETPPKPDAENSNPDHIAHALEDQRSSINDTKSKIQELQAKTSSLEAKIKSLKEAITDMSQELINPPIPPEFGNSNQSANNPHPSDKLRSSSLTALALTPKPQCSLRKTSQANRFPSPLIRHQKHRLLKLRSIK